MAERIRTLVLGEWEDFHRFMERCYGHSWDYFPRAYAHIYRKDHEALSGLFVLENGGRIVSHVGLFPLECVAFDSRVLAGGIGGVATLPEDRGKGYMSRLLPHVIDRMKDLGMQLSCLGGDRQRYNAFGYEFAGLRYSLLFSRRSMDRAGVRAAAAREVAPLDAVSQVESLSRLLPLRVDRRHTGLLLGKPGLRAWVVEDGYLLSRGEREVPLNVLEVASASGEETGLIRAAMDQTFATEASLPVSSWDSERQRRLLPAACSWDSTYDWTYRVVDLYSLLQAYKGWLEKKALALAPCELSIGLKCAREVQQVTISAGQGKVEIVRECHADGYLELDTVDGVRLLLGGPAPVGDLGTLAALLPLPIHVPLLDYV